MMFKKGKSASSLHIFWLNRVAIMKWNLSELKVVKTSRTLGWSAGVRGFTPTVLKCLYKSQEINHNRSLFLWVMYFMCCPSGLCEGCLYVYMWHTEGASRPVKASTVGEICFLSTNSSSGEKDRRSSTIFSDRMRLSVMTRGLSHIPLALILDFCDNSASLAWWQNDNAYIFL